MTKDIGPKEQQLKALREGRFETKKSQKSSKGPSASDLRKKVAKIAPTKVKKGKRGR